MNEVASFVQPFNQFLPAGQVSVYRCVEAGIADIYYSGPPGKAPAGTVAEVEALESSLYTTVVGPDVPSDVNGTTLPEEYAALTKVNPPLKFLVLNTIDDVKHASQNLRLPILFCGPESGMFDVGLGRVPYAWQPSGNHCIVISDYLANGNVIVRDYANSEFFGYAREYKLTQGMVSATAVYPRWFVTNPGSDPAFLLNLWSATALFIGGVPDYNTGIAETWKRDVSQGLWRGAPLMHEGKTIWKGKQVPWQLFTAGFYTDEGGVHYWHPNT